MVGMGVVMLRMLTMPFRMLWVRRVLCGILRGGGVEEEDAEEEIADDAEGEEVEAYSHSLGS